VLFLQHVPLPMATEEAWLGLLEDYPCLPSAVETFLDKVNVIPNHRKSVVQSVQKLHSCQVHEQDDRIV